MTNRLMVSPKNLPPPYPQSWGSPWGRWTQNHSPLCGVGTAVTLLLCSRNPCASKAAQENTASSLLSIFMSSSKCLLSCVCIITSKMHQPRSAHCTPAQTTCLSSWSVPLCVSISVPLNIRTAWVPRGSCSFPTCCLDCWAGGPRRDRCSYQLPVWWLHMGIAVGLGLAV